MMMELVNILLLLSFKDEVDDYSDFLHSYLINFRLFRDLQTNETQGAGFEQQCFNKSTLLFG